MNISIIGAHGNIAMLLHPILKAQGHHVRGLIRKKEQAYDLKEAGAEPIICDIEKEDDISEAVGQADVVIFAAGAGPGSGAARKWTVDRDGAIKLIEAAKANGIKRYVMISAMGTKGNISHENGVFETYLKAKAEADEALRTSGLDYAIVKPGRLTDAEGTGHVHLAPEVPRSEISRVDVAAVLAEVTDNPDIAGLEFQVTKGEQPIADAIEQIVA